MIITNKTEIAFNTETEKDFITKFAKENPTWTQEGLGKFTIYSKTKIDFLNPDDKNSYCRCEVCKHAKTQTLMSGDQQLICEISSDWRVVHPYQGCNYGATIE